MKNNTSAPLPNRGPYRTAGFRAAKLCPHCGGELVPATTLPRYITVSWRSEEARIRRLNAETEPPDTTGSISAF
jgi:hypothetical protein